MSEKSQFTATHRATKLCVSTRVVSGSNLTLYMVNSLFYQSKSRQTCESWTLPQSPTTLSKNRAKISSYQNQLYPSQSGQKKTANRTAVCYAFRLEVQRSPTRKSFFIWQCVPSPFPKHNSQGMQLPRLYQTSHLQNADPLWKLNNYSPTRSAFKHARSPESEPLHLRCSETQKPRHKEPSYKWEIMK